VSYDETSVGDDICFDCVL